MKPTRRADYHARASWRRPRTDRSCSPRSAAWTGRWRAGRYAPAPSASRRSPRRAQPVDEGRLFGRLALELPTATTYILPW